MKDRVSLFAALVLERSLFFGLKYSILLIMIKNLGYTEDQALIYASSFFFMITLSPLFIIPLVDRFLSTLESQFIGSVLILFSVIALLVKMPALCMIFLGLGSGFFLVSVMINIIRLNLSDQKTEKENLFSAIFSIICILIFINIGSFSGTLVLGYFYEKFGIVGAIFICFLIGAVLILLSFKKHLVSTRADINKLMIISGIGLTLITIIYKLSGFNIIYKDLITYAALLIIFLYLAASGILKNMPLTVSKLSVIALIFILTVYGVLQFYKELLSSAAYLISESSKIFYQITRGFALEAISMLMVIPIFFLFKRYACKIHPNILISITGLVLLVYLLCGCLLISNTTYYTAILFLLLFLPGLDVLLYTALAAWILIKTPHQYWFGWLSGYFILSDITTNLYEQYSPMVDTGAVLADEVVLSKSLFDLNLVTPWVISAIVMLFIFLILRKN